MREFFKPWRRKVGVVSVGLACVFMAGWVRSYQTDDQFEVFGHMFVSFEGSFYEMSRTVTVSNQGGSNIATIALSPLWQCPYWTVVAPLTLLSTYLLLSKPRPAKKPNPSLPPEPDHV